MADDRINGFEDELLPEDVGSLIDTLELAIDDPSWAEADPEEDTRKVKWRSLLYSSSVEDSTDNNFQALTPEGFQKSTGTETRAGIHRTATPLQIDSGGVYGSGVLHAYQLHLIKEKVLNQLFIQNGVVEPVYKDADSPISELECLQYAVTWQGSMSSGELQSFKAYYGSSLQYETVTVMISVLDTSTQISYGGVLTVKQSTSGVIFVNIPGFSGNLRLYLTRYGDDFGIFSLIPYSKIKVSMTVTAVTRA